MPAWRAAGLRAEGWGLQGRVEVCFGGKLRELVLLDGCGGGGAGVMKGKGRPG